MQPKGIVGTLMFYGGIVPALALSVTYFARGALIFHEDPHGAHAAWNNPMLAILWSFLFLVPTGIVSVVWRAWQRAKVLKRGERPREDAAATATCAAVTAFGLFAVLETLLLAYVAPQFDAMFATMGGVLPPLSESVMAISRRAEQWWPLAVGGASVATALYGFAFRWLCLRRACVLSLALYVTTVTAHCLAIDLIFTGLFMPLI